MTETTTDRPVDTSATSAVTRWLAEGVGKMLAQTLNRVQPSVFSVTDELGAAGADNESWIKFETSVGRGIGHLRLRDGRAWTLLTTLNDLKGHEEPKHDRRPRGTEHGAVPNRETWLEQRRREAEELGRVTQPYVVIVGGGQGGIALGARLRQLSVPTIIVDRNPRPGDAWRKRYKSLTLHDPVWYDHLPYIDFPPNWPVFSPKDKIADWLEMYTRVMELNYWDSTECKSASYDEAAKEWTVVVEHGGVEMTLRPKQLVLATGMSGKPSMPDIEGMDVFTGDQHHSSHRPHFRVDSLPTPTRVSDPGLRRNPRTRRRLLRAAGESRLHARLRRRQLGVVHEVPTPRLRLLHRRGRLGTSGQRRYQARVRRQCRPPH